MTIDSPPRRPSADEQLFNITALMAAFVFTRILIMLSLRLEQVSFVANDVSYYTAYLFQLEQGDLSAMREYPMPAVWLLQAIYTIGGGWEEWTPWYSATMLLLDVAVAATLYRRANVTATLFWILFTGAQGAIMWFRFDLIPAALVAWACVLLLRRPAVSGALLGLGAAIKLWPALLIGPLLAPDPLRAGPARRRLLGFGVAGLGLALTSLAAVGWERTVSPVTWQRSRGLQIESVPAMPLMWLRTFTDNPSWPISLSDYNALEIEAGSPGVGLMLGVATALTAATVALTAWLSARLIRNLRRDDPLLPPAILFAMLAVVLATIVTNKTLSPQYILWLGGPIAALLLTRMPERLRRHLRIQAVALVIVGALTQLSYPWGAYGIMAIPLGSGPETAVLVLRNLALLTLTGHAVWLAMVTSRRASTTESPLYWVS
ncbi:MAG TPA: glycosyltransferase family 87 protein [Arachnia sp.]|nr:glycosyltransferase family 87 protein [Arachnia sp.]